MISSFNDKALARSSSNDLEAITTISTGQFCWAMLIVKSGPMPAGSPGVIAMRFIITQ
jgi:hypothetical protein